MVDISGGMQDQFNAALKRAQALYAAGEADMAAQEYERCARIMKELVAAAVSPSVQRQRIEKAKQYLELAKRIRAGEPVAVTREERAQASEQARKKARPEPEKREEDSLSGEIEGLIKRASVTWDEIGGLDQAKTDIRAALAMAMAAPPKGVRIRTSRNVLLYGPPGTGKTLLAAAASNGLNATFFNITVSSLLSKFFGESSKLVSALFAEARRRAPSVVFFDEVDALAPARDRGVDGAEKRVLSSLLSELDGLEGKNSDKFLYVIGATNAPWDMDDAILSRFGRLVHVPLPDPDTRRSILAIHLDRNGIGCALSKDELVSLTEGYSGRDIEGLCSVATELMVKAANPDLLSRAGGGTLNVRPVSAAEMREALRLIRPKTDAATAGKYERWAGGRS